jgi:anti-sigma factor RsiW
MTEALEIARQIAEALEAAHDRGIRTICTLASEFMIGGSWNSQGVILFSLAPQNSRPDERRVVHGVRGGRSAHAIDPPAEGRQRGRTLLAAVPAGRPAVPVHYLPPIHAPV